MLSIGGTPEHTTARVPGAATMHGWASPSGWIRRWQTGPFSGHEPPSQRQNSTQATFYWHRARHNEGVDIIPVHLQLQAMDARLPHTVTCGYL